MGEIRAMGPEGDTKLIWDAANTDEVDAAKMQFEKLTSKDFIAYSVKKKGGKGKKITKFDASEERIILVPPLVGG